MMKNKIKIKIIELNINCKYHFIFNEIKIEKYLFKNKI